jgi:hypothetical protein
MNVKTQIKAGPLAHNHNEALVRAARGLTDRTGVTAVGTSTILIGPSTTSHPSFTAFNPSLVVGPLTASAHSPGGWNTSCPPE